MKSIAGKWQALTTLATQARFFSNWPDVFSAYRRMQPLPPLKLRSGVTLYHGQNDDAWSIFREIFVDRCYSSPRFYAPKASDVVIDCGANIGFFTLYLQSVAPGIQVHCFEPSASTRQRLMDNLRKNGCERSVSVHPYALLDQEKDISLAVASHAGSSTMFATAPVAEQVHCLTLGQALKLCGDRDIDLLKMDVEGAELEILAGADATSWRRVRRVAMEYHEALRPGCRDRVVAALKPHFKNVHAWATVPSGDLGIIQAS